MTRRPHLTTTQHGIALVSVLVALGFSVALAVGISMLVARSGQSEASAELRADRARLKRAIGAEIDCTAVFAAAGGIDPADSAACASSSAAGGQTGPWLRLLRRTLGGTAAPLTGALDASGAGKSGRWSVRASCSAAEKSLIVRVARLAADGSSLADPLRRGLALGWSDPDNLLFGGTGAEASLPLCYGKGVDAAKTHWDDGIIKVPMAIEHSGGPNYVKVVEVPTVGTPVAANCQPAYWGNWNRNNSYEQNCYCYDSNVTPGANKVTFALVAQICAFPANCGGVPEFGGSLSAAYVESRTRGPLTAPQAGGNACIFNWSILLKD